MSKKLEFFFRNFNPNCQQITHQRPSQLKFPFFSSPFFLPLLKNRAAKEGKASASQFFSVSRRVDILSAHHSLITALFSHLFFCLRMLRMYNNVNIDSFLFAIFFFHSRLEKSNEEERKIVKIQDKERKRGRKTWKRGTKWKFFFYS